MKILQNTNKYLSSELINECFESGRINYLDKVITGNGFTTGFSFLKPAFNKVNILIAPNQSIVKDKEKEYAVGDFAPSKRCAFVYEGNGLKGSHSDYDLIVLVADSFNNFSYKLKGHIDKLMVDEFHSVIIQSPFRSSLKKLLYSLENDFKEAAISFVTASPLLYSKIDIQINNTYVEDRVLHTSSDLKESIKRCVSSIESGKKTMIFTHDSAIVKNILTTAKRNNFKLISGTSFRSTLLTKGIYKLDENSNIVICSSAGFEGHSDYSEAGHNYIFMNLGNAHNTFLGCNIYQSIGRLRKGYEYSECCVLNAGGGGFPNKIVEDLEGKIEKFISIDNVPIEHKQSKNFKFYYNRKEVKTTDLMNYIHFKRDKNVYTAKPYFHGIDVHNETKQIDTKLKVYESYFKVRNITLQEVDRDITQRRMLSRIKREQRINHIVENIRTNNLIEDFDTFFFKSFNPDKKIEYYIKEIEIMQECAFHLGHEIDNKYQLLKEYMENGGYYKEIKQLLINLKREWNESEKAIRESMLAFDDTIFEYTLDVAVGITKDYFERNIVGHRDYNKLTLIGIDIIEFITKKLNKELVEVDVKNCFPRIIYALNGYELPIDFYGEDRAANKKKINVLLNSFRYDKNKYRSETQQKSDAIRNLTRSGINDNCVEWLIDRFFKSPFRGDLFNYLAYHERQIIGQAIGNLTEYNNDIKLYRRHDSFLSFNELSYKSLNSFEYLGVGGWFNSYKPNEDKFILEPLLF